MATTPSQLVQQLYLAYYGRPADPASLAYWSAQLAAQPDSMAPPPSVISPFFSSPESRAFYGGEPSLTAHITSLYQNLLGRPPEPGPGSLPFWTQQVTSGAVSREGLTLSFLQGALGSDQWLVNARLQVSDAFTALLQARGLDYEGTAAAAIARTLVHSVTRDPASLTKALAMLPVYAHVAGVASADPQTFESRLIEDGLLTNSRVLTLDLTPDNIIPIAFPPAPAPLPVPMPPSPAPEPPAPAPPVDDVPPTLTISSNKSQLKAGETATITFTFSEVPVGFDASDITISGGALSGLAVTSDSKVYTATYTPEAVNSLNGSIRVDAAKYTDAAGNSGGASNALSFTGDTLAPTITAAAYSANKNTLTLTGKGFNELGAVDIRDQLDWSKLVWDIDGNGLGDGTDVTFTKDDIHSTEVTSSTTLSIKLTDVKAAALEGTEIGGDVRFGITLTNPNNAADKVFINSGFLQDPSGNAAGDFGGFVRDAQIVVFDIAGQRTSDHSGRTFVTGESYAVVVNVTPPPSEPGTNAGSVGWGVWDAGSYGGPGIRSLAVFSFAAGEERVEYDAAGMENAWLAGRGTVGVDWVKESQRSLYTNGWWDGGGSVQLWTGGSLGLNGSGVEAANGLTAPYHLLTLPQSLIDNQFGFL